MLQQKNKQNCHIKEEQQMLNDNVVLEIVDEHIEEGFIIDSDDKAEWALRKIAEEQAETQRYINVCQTMINEYQAKIQKAQEGLNNKTSYLKALLAQYFETVPKRKPKLKKHINSHQGFLKEIFRTRVCTG